MAIFKSGLKVSRNSSHSQTQSSSSTDDELRIRPYQEDSGAESDTTDDSDIAEVGAELCMVGDQTCSVPYELFDLPDLKHILSLDTWNSCLTEEDRYNLTAYLPDMDQQTFNLTLKQLLGGETLNFISPMAELFDRLKGGLCPPKVSRYMEGSLYLQRKLHYHSLKNYHNNMVNNFMEMQKIWNNCPPGAGVEERLRIWYSGKNRKNFLQTERQDLLPYSKHRLESSRTGKARRPPSQPSKKATPFKCQGVTDIVYPPYPEKNLTTAKVDAKGVLKLKAPTKGPLPSEISTGKLESKEILKIEKRTPKGVLKQFPKGVLRHEQPQMKQENFPLKEIQGHETKSRPSLYPQAQGGWEGDSFIGEASLGLPKSKDRRKKHISETPDSARVQQGFEYPYSNAPGKIISAYDKKMKRAKGQPILNNMGVHMHPWLGQDGRNFEEDDDLVAEKRYLKDLPTSRRFVQDGGMFSEDASYTPQQWRHFDKQNREYQRSSIEHYADGGDWQIQNFHQPLSYDRQINHKRELDLEGSGKVRGEQNNIQKNFERSKKKRKEVKQSLEDSFRHRSEQKTVTEEHGEKQDFLEERLNFIGNRRHPLDASGFSDDTKWSDQGKILNGQKRWKQSQIGDASLDIDRSFEEPMAFESLQNTKRNKKKKDHEKSEAAEFFPSQPIRTEYDTKVLDGSDKQKTMKIKIKKPSAKIPDSLTELNGPQDFTQSS